MVVVVAAVRDYAKNWGGLLLTFLSKETVQSEHFEPLRGNEISFGRFKNRASICLEFSFLHEFEETVETKQLFAIARSR